MEVVIEQSELLEKRITFQWEIPPTLKCRKCKGECALMMQVLDTSHALVAQRPKKVRVWPHDDSVTHIYLCTTCGSMRATWNQG